MRERSHNTTTICDFNNSRKHVLQRHIEAVHERMKSHKYSMCDFNFKVVLNKHIEDVHEGTKPHKSQMFNL